MALTGEGAAGCASGSQTCPNGHMPILMPKPDQKQRERQRRDDRVARCSNSRQIRAHGVEIILQAARPLAAAPVTASISAPIMVAAQAICIMHEELVGGADVVRVSCAQNG